MKHRAKKISAVGSSLLLLTGAAGAGAFVVTDAAQAQDVVSSEATVSRGLENVAVPHVQGSFSFTQGVVSSTEHFAKNVAAASKYLCAQGGVAQGQAVSPDEWTVQVGGDVRNSYIATLSELSDKGSAQIVMGCSCAGNPSGGNASGNAEVFGATIASIIEEAQPADTVNTVVFTCADGYKIELPLFYVAQHFSVLAFSLNGEPLDNSMGGTNQLWLGSTAANYFAQDVVGITFETRDEAPSVPDAGAQNTPNATIVSAEVM